MSHDHAKNALNALRMAHGQPPREENIGEILAPKPAVSDEDAFYGMVWGLLPAAVSERVKQRESAEAQGRLRTITAAARLGVTYRATSEGVHLVVHEDPDAEE